MRALAPVSLLLAALTLLAPAYANHGSGATYRGRVASGGSLTFVVAANGKSVTRFTLKNVVTDCGTISTTTTGRIAIANHAFLYSAAGFKFKGSFPARNKANGTLSYRTPYPSCTSAAVGWNATRR